MQGMAGHAATLHGSCPKKASARRDTALYERSSMKRLSPWSDIDSWIIDTDEPRLTIDATALIQTHDISAIRLDLTVGGDFSFGNSPCYRKSFTGSAKRDPHDAYDGELGALIAARSALRQIVNELDKQVEGRISMKENLKKNKNLTFKERKAKKKNASR